MYAIPDKDVFLKNSEDQKVSLKIKGIQSLQTIKLSVKSWNQSKGNSKNVQNFDLKRFYLALHIHDGEKKIRYVVINFHLYDIIVSSSHASKMKDINGNLSCVF